MYICQSKSLKSTHLSYPLSIHTFVLYICVSISCKQVHLYHFSRSHIYAFLFVLCINGCFSDLTFGTRMGRWTMILVGFWGAWGALPWWRDDSLGKILMLGKIEGKRTRGWQRIRWSDSITNSSVDQIHQWTWKWTNSRRQCRTGNPGVLQSTGSQRAGHDLATEQQ